MIENIKEYIENLKTKTPIVKAEKSGCILARIGQEGEQIKTFVSNGTLETINRVKKNNKGELDIVVTMANLQGEPVIDTNGHTNTYIIPRETFDKKYKNSEEWEWIEKKFAKYLRKFIKSVIISFHSERSEESFFPDTFPDAQ